MCKCRCGWILDSQSPNKVLLGANCKERHQLLPWKNCQQIWKDNEYWPMVVVAPLPRNLNSLSDQLVDWLKKEKREGKKKKSMWGTILPTSCNQRRHHQWTDARDPCLGPSFYFRWIHTVRLKLVGLGKSADQHVKVALSLPLHLPVWRLPPVLNQRGWCRHVGGQISFRTIWK